MEKQAGQDGMRSVKGSKAPQEASFRRAAEGEGSAVKPRRNTGIHITHAKGVKGAWSSRAEEKDGYKSQEAGRRGSISPPSQSEFCSSTDAAHVTSTHPTLIKTENTPRVTLTNGCHL